MSFCIELFCVVTLQYQILVRIAIAYFIIEKKKAVPQPWQAIAQRFCSIGSSRLSFAKPEFMKQYLDITPGSVSVMGLMNDIEHKVQLLIDEDILKKEYFGCHPCVNTSSLKFKTTDLMERIIPALGHTQKMVRLG